MKSLLGNYKRQIDAIFRGMDLLVDYEFVPFRLNEKEVTKATIDELKEIIKKEQFIVSVCGQIKAGKSTFLNYLLFDGENILPTDDVPWTAKITKISNGKDPHALIHYYSLANWEVLKTTKNEEVANSISHYEQFLKEELEIRANRGIRETDKIKISALTERKDDLNDLGNYVGKKGDYTPFVDYVEIIIDNEFIKDIILVDTPGLNDPNILRSRLTKEFIDKSSAVIYLMHSEEPLGKSDFEFIDKYLFLIPPDKLIFALSKCDNIPGDEREVINYVEENLTSKPEVKNRKLLEGRKVFAISTMAAIINRKKSKGIPLTKDEEFYRGKILDNLIAKEGNLPDVIKTIEHNIMADKGEAIIRSTNEKIKGYCVTKLNELRNKNSLLSYELDALSLSKSELKSRIDELKKVRDDLDDYKENCEIKLNVIMTNYGNESFKQMGDMKQEIIKDFHVWLGQCKKFEEIRNSSQYEIKEFTDRRLRLFLVSGIGSSLKDELSDFQSDIKATLKDKSKSVLDSRWSFLFAPIIDIQFVTELIKKHFAELTRDYLEQCRHYKFLRFTDFETSKREVETQLKISLDDLFDKTLFNELIAKIQAEADKFMESILGNLNKNLQVITKNLLEIQKETGSKEERQSEIGHQLDKLEEMIGIKTQQSKEIEHIIGV